MHKNEKLQVTRDYKRSFRLLLWYAQSTSNFAPRLEFIGLHSRCTLPSTFPSESTPRNSLMVGVCKRVYSAKHFANLLVYILGVLRQSPSMLNFFNCLIVRKSTPREKRTKREKLFLGKVLGRVHAFAPRVKFIFNIFFGFFQTKVLNKSLCGIDPKELAFQFFNPHNSWKCCHWSVCQRSKRYQKMKGQSIIWMRNNS